MPNINLGSGMGTFGPAAAQLVAENQRTSQLLLDREQFDFQKQQALAGAKAANERFAVDAYLRSRGLDIQEGELGLRQDELGVRALESILKQKQIESDKQARQAMWEAEFASSEAVKEAQHGIKYDPGLKKYIPLKPGEGLYNPMAKQKPDYQLAKFMQDEVQGYERQIWNIDKEIVNIDEKLGDIMFVDKAARANILTRQNDLVRERDALKVKYGESRKKWDEYMGQFGMAPSSPEGITSWTDRGYDTRQPESSPTPLAVQPGSAFEAAPSGAPLRESFWSSEAGKSLLKQVSAKMVPSARSETRQETISQEQLTAISSALARASNRIDKGNIKANFDDYNNTQLTRAMSVLENPNVIARMKELGIKPEVYKRLIEIEMLRRSNQAGASPAREEM